MKKFISLLFLLTTCISVSQAQYDDLYTFEKGKSLLGVNIGVRLGNANKTAFSASYEYGLANLFVDECMLGGGVFGGYYKDKLGNEIEKIYIVGIKINIHYQFIDRLDTYAGFAPNFNIKAYELKNNEAQFECYFHFGGRYYLTNWLGVFAEVSTGFNNFSGGLSIKF